MDAARARKLADQIVQIVAEMLERRIKDPRLGFVTITEARLTGDLREATVYYTVLGTDEERAATAAALLSATGIIRTEVGRQLGLRHTPSLEFVADVLPDNARRIDDLLAAAKSGDGELAPARGMTSPDVVARLRRLAGPPRVGHAGTLDPMATGVLVVGVEQATRLLGYLTLTEKEYAATIRLGQSTSTDDAEGDITGTASAVGVSAETLA